MSISTYVALIIVTWLGAFIVLFFFNERTEKFLLKCYLWIKKCSTHKIKVGSEIYPIKIIKFSDETIDDNNYHCIYEKYLKIAIRCSVLLAEISNGSQDADLDLQRIHADLQKSANEFCATIELSRTCIFKPGTSIFFIVVY